MVKVKPLSLPENFPPSMSLVSYIVWSADPDLFEVGNLTIRWYGLLFATGFLLSQQIMFYFFRKEGKPENDVETLTIYMVIATIIGARLGHVLFYEPARYLSNPIDILKIWEGGLASHGATIGILTALYLYSNYTIKIGLFKFKATIKKHPRPGQSFLWIVDRIVIVVALTGCLIRFGNFMNSEIVGHPTNSSNGVVFAWEAVDMIQKSYQAVESADASKPEGRTDTLMVSNTLYHPITLTIHFNRADYPEDVVRQYLESTVKSILTDYQSVSEHIYEPAGAALNYTLTQDRGAYKATVQTWGIPRHPTQLYESISALLIFIALFLIWKRYREKTPEGFLFGLFLIVLFGFRFFIEFFKENQVAFEDNLPLNMGQWLSIPLVLIGIYLIIRANRQQKKKTANT